jgi:autotransporter-associated beta strand protein
MKSKFKTTMARRMAGLLQETCLSTPASRLALSTLVAVGVLLPLQAHAANFNVGTEAQLRNAISTAANGDTITFTADIALTSPLPNLQRSIMINGANFTLSGSNHSRVLNVQSGTVDLVDLKIVNGRVQGGSGGNAGSGGGGGGGAAGLGGALYIASTGAVTATNVSFNGNTASGGNGGHRASNAPGGGGGGGGTSGNGANANAGGAGGAGGGGNGSPTASGQGQPGGFGGGGGGGGQLAGAGGFGGGGGGGGGVTIGGTAGAAGGFGGGNGNAAGDALAGGGGGAGLGGAIFVQEGGQLAFNGTLTISGNTAQGGNAGSTTSTGGQGHGSGLFLHGSGEFTVAPAIGETQTIQDTIADQKGVSGSGGSWTLDKQGAGTTILTGFDNAYSGGIKIKAGILQGHSGSLLGNIASTGGTIVFDQRLDGTYAGSMTGAGAFTKTGLNTLKLTGNNTYSGATTVTGGTLLLTSATSLSGPGGVITLNNGTIGRSDDLTLGPATVIDRAVTLVNDGGFVVQSVRNELTVSSVIDGGGRLVKSGVGTLVLTGTNTYAGGTMVNGGLVSFATDANLGAAGTGITLDGGSIGTTTTPAGTSFTRTITLTGNGGISVGQHPITWAGNIVGPGQLIKSGNGELELTGTNTYGGGTLVQRGTLRISSDDKLGFAGSEVTLQENGALRASETFTIRRNINLVGAGGVILVDGGKTLTLNGIVSGSNILKVGDGTVILDGANTYTGTTQVSQGILQGNSNTIRGNVAFDETVLSKSLVFDQAVDGTFAGNIAGVGLTNGNGSVVKNGAGTLTLTGTNKYTGGTTVNAGTLQGTTTSLQGSIANNAAVIFNQSFDGTYAGNMTGTGTLTKNGSGKVTITGTNTIGGGTTINAGGFAVNGSLTSNVTLNGGILSGAGNITGDITQNGGEIAPGNSIGTITINGNYTVRSGILEFEINSNGQNDKINVVGAGHKATLQGGTIEVIALAGTYRPNSTYTLISAAGGVVGKFDRTTSNLAFLTPSLSYDANNVYISLALASNAFASAGQTINQQAVGGALDAIAASGNVDGIVTVMANLPNGAGAPALQALSGQPYADFGTLNARASQLFMNSVGRQMATERGAGLGSGPQRVALAEACVIACDTTEPSRFGAWVAGIGSTGSVLGDANASSFTYTMGGTAFGIDYRLDPRFLVGIAGGYTSGTQWVNGFSGNGYSDSFSVALYGSFTQNGSGPGFYTDALVGYANANNRMQRVISLPGNPTALANGNTSANQFLGQIEAGYKFGLGLGANTSISPFARLQVASINQAGFTEYGGGPFNLSVAAQNTTSVRTTFGVDLAGSFDIGGGTLLDLGLRLGWMHEFADTARPMTAGFAASPGSQFTVFGATPQRDSAVIGFSAATALSDRTSLFVSYDGEIGGGTDNHSLRAGFRITW